MAFCSNMSGGASAGFATWNADVPRVFSRRRAVLTSHRSDHGLKVLVGFQRGPLGSQQLGLDNNPSQVAQLRLASSERLVDAHYARDEWYQ